MAGASAGPRAPAAAAEGTVPAVASAGSSASAAAAAGAGRTVPAATGAGAGCRAPTGAPAARVEHPAPAPCHPLASCRGAWREPARLRARATCVGVAAVRCEWGWGKEL